LLRRSGTFTRQGSQGSRASGRLKPAGSILGARIRVGRLSAGLTLRELGQMLHPKVHHSTISNWERAKRVPGRASMAQLADLFNWGTADVHVMADDSLTSGADGRLIAGGAGAVTSASAAGPGQSLRLEALLGGLRAAYDEAFEDGQAVAYGEAQKEIQLLRKQLASERDRVERQRDQLVQLQRSADMRRLAEDRGRPN
jgi:transcriptional regulator with XRE-family HTH domain